MNIAVISEQGPGSGGAFQQDVSTFLVLNGLRSEKYNFTFITTEKNSLGPLREAGLEVFYLRISLFDRVWGRMRGNEIIHGFIRASGLWKYSKLDKFLMERNIDLVFFLSPTRLSLVTECHSHMVRVLDQCHRDFMEFPEVSKFGEFEGRERILRNSLPRAIAVIVDSEYGKINMVRRYGLDEERIRVLPYLPSRAVRISAESGGKLLVDIKKKYGIQGDYVFYPAQFWTHKNHRYILEALKILKERHKIRISAVFCGKDRGNKDFILAKALEYGIGDRIICPGFVEDREMPSLYRQAVALVMPTYFGPTNIPPLEAFALGCPVCYPDLPGLREQVKDAAYLMDLANPESLVGILMEILENGSEVSSRIEQGKRIVSQWNEEKYREGLEKIFHEYEMKSRCWK